MLKHVQEGAMESLASFTTDYSEFTMSRGCKWVVWTLEIDNPLPRLVCSEALGVKLRFDTLYVLFGVAVCTG